MSTCSALLSQFCRGEELPAPRLSPVEQILCPTAGRPAFRPTLQWATRPIFFPEREVHHVYSLGRCCHRDRFDRRRGGGYPARPGSGCIPCSPGLVLQLLCAQYTRGRRLPTQIAKSGRRSQILPIPPATLHKAGVAGPKNIQPNPEDSIGETTALKGPQSAS